MRLLIDKDAVGRFVPTTETGEYGDYRRYYAANLNEQCRIILSLRNGLSLRELAGCVVDAQIGWDKGTPGFVWESDERCWNTKVTIYRRLNEPGDAESLTSILKNAPHR